MSTIQELNNRFRASGVGAPKGKDRNKVKYTCGACGAAVWGKPDLLIVCGKCVVPFASV